MSYDPSTRGARCHDGCPLGPDGALRACMSRRGPGARADSSIEPFIPVPGEVHDLLAERTVPSNIRVAALLIQPGPDEERRGYPLAGRSGNVWNDCLRAIGRRRQDVDLFNIGDCKPPGPASGAWDRMEKGLALLRKEEATRHECHGVAASKAREMAILALPHPGECCRPRLLRDLAPYNCILALGGEPYKALTGKASAVTKVMGSPEWIDFKDSNGAKRQVKLFALPHPAHVLRAPAWRDPYMRMLAKAFRFFEDRLLWIEPDWFVNPTPMKFASWLAWVRKSVPFVSVDSETNSIEPMAASIEMVQIATPDLDQDGNVTLDQRLADERGTRSQVVVLLFPGGAYGDWDPAAEASTFGQRIRRMPASEIDQHRRLLSRVLADAATVKFGSNIGYYDSMVFEDGPDKFVNDPAFNVASAQDLLFAARFRAPDLPKGLKQNGVIFTDVERWDTVDSGEKALRSKKIHERVKYAGYDACVGARIAPPLVQAAAEAGAFRELPAALRPVNWPTPGQPADTPWNLWELDHERQRMCVRMHRRGVWVDQKERATLQTRFEASVAARRERLADLVRKLRVQSQVDEDSLLVGDEGREEEDEYNAGSADQLRVLLYEDLGLDIPLGIDEEDAYTDTGQLSTADPVLRAFLAQPGLDPVVRQLVAETRLLRRERNKVLGTFLWPMAPGGEKQNACLWPDGRVRGVWGAHTTAPARLSCSGFPMQIIGSRKGLDVLKRLFAAEQGVEPRGLVWQCHDCMALEVRDDTGRNIFVAADAEQAHLRIMANHWGIRSLLECFDEGLDAYGRLALVLYGDGFRNAAGWGPDGFDLHRKPPVKGSPARAMRETAKQALLSLAYYVSVPTATATIMSTEFARLDPKTGMPTGETVLPYLNLELPELGLSGMDVVEHWRDLWLRDDPSWEVAWAGAEQRYVDNGGFLSDPVLGRRSGVLSDGKPTEVINSEILTAEASIMSLMEREVERIFDPEMGDDGLAARGLSAGELKGSMQEAMTVRIQDWGVPFTAEAKAGLCLADV